MDPNQPSSFLCAQTGQRGRQQTQFSYTMAITQNFSEARAGPPAVKQQAIELWKSRRHADGGLSCRGQIPCFPDRGIGNDSLEHVQTTTGFQSINNYCNYIQYRDCLKEEWHRSRSGAGSRNPDEPGQIRGESGSIDASVQCHEARRELAIRCGKKRRMVQLRETAQLAARRHNNTRRQGTDMLDWTGSRNHPRANLLTVRLGT